MTLSQSVRQLLPSIRLLILDVDGVMTDGRVRLDARGSEIKAFNVKDGFALSCWRRSGGATAIITGRKSEAVDARCRELQIPIVMQGVKDKSVAFADACTRAGVGAEATAAMGDDIPDLPMLRAAALACAPADAADEVRDEVDWVSTRRGGEGAVRDIVRTMMIEQGTWANAAGIASS